MKDLNLQIWVDEFISHLRDYEAFKTLKLSHKSIGYIMDTIADGISEGSVTDRILYLYLLHNDDSFFELVSEKLKYFGNKIDACEDGEMKMFTEEFITDILPKELEEISNYIMRKKDIKVGEEEIHRVSRKVVFILSEYDQTYKRNRLLQALYAYNGSHGRNCLYETKLQCQRNGTTRNLYLQRF